jgi:hypothetical protein
MTNSNNLPKRINAMALLTYDVPQVVADLKYQGMEDSDIDIETIVNYIEEDAADYFGTNNLIFQDENGSDL